MESIIIFGLVGRPASARDRIGGEAGNQGNVRRDSHRQSAGFVVENGGSTRHPDDA
jgi:hypothetical protein